MTAEAFTDPPEPPASVALWAYLAATTLIAPFAPLILRRRLARGTEDPARWREKLGQTTAPRPEGPLLWLHAVSVGEGLSILPLLNALAPKIHILLTCTTVTSAQLMATRVPAGVTVQFLPLDLPAPVRRFLRHWRPDVAVMVESEFWPRLIRETHARAIPLLLVNARISDSSFARWQRMRGLAAALLGRFSALTAPDEAVARKLRALGADPARLHVTGSLKRGANRLPVGETERARLAAAFGPRPLWLAASTHAGEETAVAAAHRTLRDSLPDALLILAPRHPDRAAALRAELEAAGHSVSQRSKGEDPAGDIYLADTLGEMGLWFDLCPVAFIGGSLVPVGGHNAYEPATHGAAILHGPHVENFADLYTRLDAAGAAETVTADSLAAALLRLQDPARRSAMTAAATATLAAEGDATAATAALILSAAASAAASTAGASKATGPYAP